MPKIDIDAVPAQPSDFPASIADGLKGRLRQALGDAVGLDQFGVNLCTIAPGSRSAYNHWHESEDELIYIVSGNLVLVEGDTETPMGPGEAAGFKAGVAVGHHFENRTAETATILEIGTRAQGERCHYPGKDMIVEDINGTSRVMTRSGQPITE